MDMVKCKVCGKDIAKNASACPHCGYKVPISNISAAFLLVILIGMALVIGFAVVSCGNSFLFPIFFP